MKAKRLGNLKVNIAPIIEMIPKKLEKKLGEQDIWLEETVRPE